MSKKYKFHVVLESHTGTASSIKTIDIELDHPYSGTDAISLEKSNDHFMTTCGVINVIPDGVTGDFTYLVHFKTEQVGCEPEQSSIVATLNHKITAKTFDSDVITIAKMIFDIDEGDVETEIPTTTILSFQEIPEE